MFSSDFIVRKQIPPSSFWKMRRLETLKIWRKNLNFRWTCHPKWITEQILTNKAERKLGKILISGLEHR